jgi:hypothetical protein
MGYTSFCPVWLLADNLNNRWSCSNTNAGLFSLYLPRLTQLGQLYHGTPGNIAKELVSDNEEAEENGGEHGLTVQDIFDAYEEVLATIRSSTNDQSVCKSMFEYIDGALTEREMYIDQLNESVFDRSLRRFRALSAVSLQCNSSRIGRVLHDFFHAIASFITTVESVPAVILWAYAIHASCMIRDEKKACLKIVVRNRPEVIEVIQNTEPTYSPIWILGRQLKLVQRELGDCDGRGCQADSQLNNIRWSKRRKPIATSASSSKMETELVSLSFRRNRPEERR